MRARLPIHLAFVAAVAGVLGGAACQVPDKFFVDGGGPDASNEVTLTITVSGNSTGTVVSTPAGLDCGSTCTVTVPRGTVLVLTATTEVGTAFGGWSGGGCSGTDDCEVVLDDDTTVDAAFDIATFMVSITAGGNGTGTVTSVPAGIDCGTDCAGIFDYGTPITLTANPDASATFLGWTGAGCAGTGPCTFDVTADSDVQASFALNNSVVVTLAGTGNGTVTSSPVGIDCGTDCSEAYGPGTNVTLTAVATGDSAFTGWSGACTGLGTCDVTTDTAVLVTASFALNQHTLTVTPTGSGSGTVVSSPLGISCGTDCSEPYDSGTPVTLTAVAAEGRFAGWSGGGCNGTGACVVDVSADTTVTATFDLITAVNVTSSTPNGLYAAPSPISIQVVFSDPVTVTGAPVLSLNTLGTATYAGGSGTNTLTFAYTVGANQLAGDLDYAGTTSLALNGGTIQDSVGNDATLTLPTPGGPGSLAANKNIGVDSVVPVVSAITGPAAYASSTSAGLTYTLTETNPGTTTCVQTTGTGTLGTCTTSGATLTALGQGAHTITVTHTDLAGNVSAPRTYSWTVDTTSPVLSTISGPAAFVSSTSASLTYTLTETNAGTTACTQTVGTGTMTACSATGASFTGLSQGAHTVTVQHTDLASNVSTVRSHSWTVDTTLPVVSAITGPASYTNATGASLTYSVTETNPSSTSCAQTTGTGTMTACSATGATFAGLSEGAHTVTVTHTDLATNVSAPRTYSWTVDTTLPVVSTITGPASPSTSTSATLSYSVTEVNPSSTTCTQTAGTGTMTSCTTTAATFTGLSTGSHTVTVTHTDLAGNTSTVRTYTWSVCPYTTFLIATAGTTFTVPAGCGTTMEVQAWGAGGGAGRWNGTHGGGGGYARGTLTVTAGQQFTVAVGGGGGFGAAGSSFGSGGVNGGGNGGPAGGAGGNGAGGGGGGWSGVFVGATPYVIAGAGGGGGGNAVSSDPPAGFGGGNSGGTGGSSNGGIGGGGGTQTGGGAGGVVSGGTNGTAGSASTGGVGGGALNGGAGGGGGGYYGGGGGGASSGGGGGGGGGGSSHTQGVTAGSTTPGSGQQPGNSTDTNYVAGRGVGGTAQSSGSTGGAAGLVVIYVHP